MEAVEIAGIKILKIYHTANTKMEFKHPKYYAALRAARKKHQAASNKRQATGPEVSSNKHQAPSGKHQAPSRKRQAP